MGTRRHWGKALLAAFLVLAMHRQSPSSERPSPGELESGLRGTVQHLAVEIGPRSYRDTGRLNRTADYIEERFRVLGLRPERQAFSYQGQTYYNIIAGVKGVEEKDPGILVVGAHYDTVATTPGADDNASGVAVLIEIARLLSNDRPARSVRLVAFSLEEPPTFMTKSMGSYVYAKSLSDSGASVYGMISLEMVGYFCREKGCQYYPSSLIKLFYPDRGDFLAFVGNLSSRRFTRGIRDAFRSFSSVPVESLNSPAIVPGVDFSDHRNFWKFGYPAFMITDTAFYRNQNYHSPGDTPDTLDYATMAEVTAALARALRSFVP